MTEKAQFMHPDAESLNALAEQALGGREREQVLAHLAICGRCRQVVFLAQKAAGAEIVPAGEVEEELVPAAVAPAPAIAAAAAREPVRERRSPWWKSWRMAWVPVGALTVAIATAYVVHVRHMEKLAELATATPQAVQNQDQLAAKPEAAEAPKEKKEGANRAEEPATGSAKTGAAGRKKAELPPPARQALEAPPEAAPVLPTAPTHANNQAPPLATGFAGGSGSGNAPGGLAVSREGSNNKEVHGSAVASLGSLAAKAGPAQAASEEEKREEADRIRPRSAMAQVEAIPAPAMSAKATAGPVAERPFVLLKDPATGLPSGLPALSIATAHHSALAVDKAGNVFLSGDAGVHWDTVARQWNGRAVAVRTPAAGKEGGAAVEGTPVILFELVNDQGQVWTSADGKTWKAK